MNNSPIGVFDSGMGGLSVWRELRRSLPGESLLYFGDGYNCPYGEKPHEAVLGYIDDAVGILVGHGAKMIVLACNTATMIAIKYLRDKYDIPFVGMEPAIKPAANSTESGIIGVLATESAIDSEWFSDLRSRYSENVTIITRPGNGFVRAVESGRENMPETYALVEAAVRPITDAGADKIVLGCTHYPFLADHIRRAAGKDVEIIDPAPAIVRRVESLLNELDLRAASGHIAEYRFMTAADEDYLHKLEYKAASIIR